MAATNDVNFREQVAKILIKWNMPTRQVAIMDIVKLHEQYLQKQLVSLRQKNMNIQTDNQNESALIIIKMLMLIPSEKVTDLENRVLTYLATAVEKYEAVRYPRET